MTNGVIGDGLMASDDELALTRRWNYLGAGLIALAFIGPSLATFAGWGSAFSVGEDVVRTLGSLAGLSLIAWLVARNKSDLTKAKARAMVGIVLCVVVGNNIARMAKEVDVGKAFVREALVFQAQQEEKFENFAKRFDEVAIIAQYMTAEALVSSDGIAAGKAVLEKYRSLLKEQNSLLQTYLTEAVALIERVPAGTARTAAVSTFGPIRDATEKPYKKISHVESEHAAAIGAIFDWAAANNGKLGVSNGELVFSSDEQRQELQTLVTRLQAAENEAALSTEEAQKMAAAELEMQKRVKKEAAEFLAK